MFNVEGELISKLLYVFNFNQNCKCHLKLLYFQRNEKLDQVLISYIFLEIQISRQKLF